MPKRFSLSIGCFGLSGAAGRYGQLQEGTHPASRSLWSQRRQPVAVMEEVTRDISNRMCTEENMRTMLREFLQQQSEGPRSAGQ